MTPPPVLSWSAQLVSSLGILVLILRKRERETKRDGGLEERQGGRERERMRERRKETRLSGRNTNKKCNILMLPLIFFIVKYF